jgi:hypothetical protein
LHDAVEHAGFGRAPLVVERIGHAAPSAEVVGHGWEPMRGACLRREAPSGRERVEKGRGVIAPSRSWIEWVFTVLLISRGGLGGGPLQAFVWVESEAKVR